jgi:hypothetical protein
MMPADRQNSRLSADIELALALAETAGVHAAAKFLTKRGAGFALICRVLAEPTRRRSTESSPAGRLRTAP